MGALAGCSGGGGGGPSPTPPVTPTIAVSAASLTFAARAGEADPAAQVVQVLNGGSGTVTGLTSSISYAGASTGWLAVDLASTTAPTTLSVRALAAAVPQGRLDATITLRAANVSGSASIAVQFDVSAPLSPLIGLSSTSLTFNWTSGGDPAAQTVNVTNNGVGTLNQLQSAITYTAGQRSGWLTATLNGQVAPATLSVAVTPGILPNATYTAAIELSSPAATNSPQSVTVTFVVARGPTIALSNTSLSFSSYGSSGSPPDQTIDITNSGGGAISDIQVAVSYGAGQATGWLTATPSSTTAPSTITAHVAPGSNESGSYQAMITITSSTAVNSPVVVPVAWSHTLPAGPTLNTPSVSGTQITLSWTFTWPPQLSSTNDQYWLEESTTGPSSGFSRIASYSQSPTHVSSFTAPALTRTTSGTYWYRVRAYTYQGWTAFSAVRTVNINAVTATRFNNNATWSIVSLKIDNVEQVTVTGTGIASGSYYQKSLSAGPHTYEAYSGYWTTSGTRFLMYHYNGTFNQAAGVIGSVTLPDATIAQLLTQFGSTGRWSGEFWVNLTMHIGTFQFLSGGTYRLYGDNVQVGSGTYQMVSYVPGLVTFRVLPSSGGSYTGTLDEINGYFMMSNGPASWPVIRYNYMGH